MSNVIPSKYDRFQLGREFRDFIKPRLKSQPGWSDYCVTQGWNGRTETLTKAEIILAAEALRYDLFAAHAQWLALGSPGKVAAMPQAPSPDEPQLGGATSKALRNKLLAEGLVSLDSIAEAMAHTKEQEKEESGANNAERFEGGDVETVIAEVLAPASVHMTPHLAGMMPDLIRDVVASAVRGPRTIVKTVVQTVDKDGAVVQPPLTVARTKTLSLFQAFGMRKSDCPQTHRHVWDSLQVDVCDYVDPLNPVDLDYLWQPSLLAELAAQDAAGMNAWVYGVAGTGKTVGLGQYAARLNRPFVRIPIERTTEPMELIGQMVPAKGGGMTWEDGKLTRAFRIPRCVILIDEPSLLRSGTLSVLQTALDTRKLYLVTGEIVPAAHGVFICACDNTNGTGDDSGRYIDTAALNAAFLDRFALKTELSFLTEGQETTMVSRRVGVHPKAVQPMVEYAKLTRQSCDAGKLTMGVTTRRLLAWANLVKIGIGSKQAFEGVVIAGAAAEDKAALIMLAGQNLTSAHAVIDGIVRGSLDPDAKPVDASTQGAGISVAGLSFPDASDPL
jgi:MoxR-like ATPase